MLLFVTNLSFAAATWYRHASVNGKLTQLSISGQGLNPSGSSKVTFNTSNLTVNFVLQ